MSKDGLAAACKKCSDGYVKRRLHSDPKYRAEHYLHVQRYHAKIREKAYQLKGNCCKNCGITDRRVLQFDHVDNNGYLDRPLGRWHGGGSYQRDLRVLRYPEKYQLLCANCHAIKTFEHRRNLERKTGALSVVEIMQSNLTNKDT